MAVPLISLAGAYGPSAGKMLLGAAKWLGPTVLSYLSRRQGQSSQSDQSTAALAQQDRQFQQQFVLAQQMRDDQLERDRLARAEAVARWLALEQQKEAQWKTRARAALPYQHASAMILGQTMGMNVPAIRSRYSTAEGVEPEPNPYGPFIYS
mgnify:CR=1 FL=1